MFSAGVADFAAAIAEVQPDIFTKGMLKKRRHRVPPHQLGTGDDMPELIIGAVWCVTGPTHQGGHDALVFPTHS